MLNTSAPSYGPPRSALYHVAIDVVHPVAHLLLGDDAPAHRCAPRQVDHRRVQRRVAPAQLGRVPAVAARHVQQRLAAGGRQAQRLGHLG